MNQLIHRILNNQNPTKTAILPGVVPSDGYKNLNQVQGNITGYIEFFKYFKI